MGFVGGGGNNCHRTCRTLINFVLYCKHPTMNGINSFFYACMRLQFLDVVTWRQTLADDVLFRLTAEYSVVMCRTWPGTLVTWLWLRLIMTYCWALILLSQICSRVGVTGARIWSHCLLLPGQGVSCHEGWLHTYKWLWSSSPTKIWAWLLGNAGFYGLWCKTELLCVQSLPHPWWSDFWLFTNINGCMQAENARATFLFVDDLNGHHQERLGFRTTNRHGVATFDKKTVSRCDQLDDGPTHARGGTFDLQMSDDWYSWPRTGCSCRTHKLRSLLSVGSHFDGSGCSKPVCYLEGFPETSCQLEYSLWCNT